MLLPPIFCSISGFRWISFVRLYLVFPLVWIFLISENDHFLHVPVGQLYVFSAEMSVQLVSPFWYIFSFSFMSSFYILNTSPLLVICYLHIFSHSVGSLLFLMIAYFAVQKFLFWCNPLCLFLLLFPCQWSHFWIHLSSQYHKIHRRKPRQDTQRMDLLKTSLSRYESGP